MDIQVVSTLNVALRDKADHEKHSKELPFKRELKKQSITKEDS